MVDQLVQYIIAQEHAGFSEAQIRSSLAAQGYPADQVKAAFKRLGSAVGDSTVREYVQQYARQGSTPSQIQSALVQQGYSHATVRKAIIEVFGPGTLPSHHVVFLLIAVLVLAGGSLLLRDRVVDFVAPAGGGEQLSPQEQIDRITLTAAADRDAAVDECRRRLRNTDRDLCIELVATDPGVLDSALCAQVSDADIHDKCLLQFLDGPISQTEKLCPQMRLQESVTTCNSILALSRDRSA